MVVCGLYGFFTPEVLYCVLGNLPIVACLTFYLILVFLSDPLELHLTAFEPDKEDVKLFSSCFVTKRQ